jgi:uncharacterized phiE125 gp8 family phage protein
MIRETSVPAVEPVTLNEAKLHCRIDGSTEDALITSLIRVAREYCETFTGRAFVNRNVIYAMDRWPSRGQIILPRPPVTSVTSVQYYDIEGAPVTLTAGTDYIADADSEPGRIVLPSGKAWPSARLHTVNPIRITYVAGYGETSASVPEYIKAAIKLCVGNWYENREAVLPAGLVGKTLPMGVESLLYQEQFAWTEDLNR